MKEIINPLKPGMLLPEGGHAAESGQQTRAGAFAARGIQCGEGCRHLTARPAACPVATRPLPRAVPACRRNAAARIVAQVDMGSRRGRGCLRHPGGHAGVSGRFREG